MGATAERPAMVKSAQRTLRVLELFDEVQRPVKVAEVMRRLEYPQSSASALLRSLARAGYLAYDARTRAYSPTERVALLGHWISPTLFGDAALMRTVKAIAQRAGHVVLLAARNGDEVQYIHVHLENPALASIFQLGMRRTLHNTTTGLALLAGLSDAEVRGMHHRLNATRFAEHPVNIPELEWRLQQVRRSGHAFTFDPHPTNTAVVAVPLPRGCSRQQIVLGVGGPTAEVADRRDAIAAVITEEVKRHLVARSGQPRPLPAVANAR